MDNQPHIRTLSIIKSAYALTLFEHFIAELKSIGPVNIHAHKTMITLANSHKKFAYITHAGKGFLHIVFHLKRRYDGNLCFTRIQEVPGRRILYHHFRMLQKDDINDEVRGFMRIAVIGSNNPIYK
jgi:hypothetical protein